MQPGDVLPLVRERLEETELVAINGQSVAAGRLGQINGLRALRLNETGVPMDREDRHGEAGFASRVIAPGPSVDDPLTVDGSIVASGTGSAGLPVLIGEGTTGPLDDEQDEEEGTGNLLDRMTPEEAAAEITQLAGLGP